MKRNDPFDLQRFVAAQRGPYRRVLEELRAGRKRSHWMWYVFPQVRGLGSSPASRKYGISGLDEARAFLQHPLLGARLRECTQLVLDADARHIGEVFPYPDDLKFRSCMTLFRRAAPEAAVFGVALDRYFDGAADPLTLAIVGAGADPAGS